MNFLTEPSLVNSHQCHLIKQEGCVFSVQVNGYSKFQTKIARLFINALVYVFVYANQEPRLILKSCLCH